jgi:hypothetical protein
MTQNRTKTDVGKREIVRHSPNLPPAFTGSEWYSMLDIDSTAVPLQRVAYVVSEDLVKVS